MLKVATQDEEPRRIEEITKEVRHGLTRDGDSITSTLLPDTQQLPLTT